MDAPLILSKGPITLAPPPGGESLVFRAMTAREELGRPFAYRIEVVSQIGQLKPADMLGQLLTVHLELRHGGLRHFNGYIADFSLAGSSGSYARYFATLRPWLWLLTRTANCRIFQHKTAPDIIKQVFRDHGFTDFEESLTASYRQRDFTVQYRETDFNFVSRLMEEEGIYYFFKHEESRHVLVMADSYSAHAATPGCEEIPYFPPDEHRNLAADFIDLWETTHQIEPGAYALTDFDFERPQANLMAKLAMPNEHSHADFEVYDYPGAYVQVANGQDYARVRLEELNREHAQCEGRTIARGLTVGSLFQLTDHPLDDQNREYLVCSATHELRTHDHESGIELGDEEVCRSTFSVIESARPFRSARLARKPVVSGPQTAIVTGQSGEEIWTDNYARIKVKFHWDRSAEHNESSSCWVRVAQLWAGEGFGGIHIPRIGQEVIIEFLEGDPDRPIVTGRVYNADNMPPYALPGNQTQSGWKSRSTKGGNSSNFNELRFEDKKGSEQVYVQAEKDMDTLVKNDETRLVGHNQTIQVDHDRQKTVKNNEVVMVQGSRTETVAKTETITIGGSRTESVGTVESISIGAARTTTVGAADALTIGGLQAVTVGAARTVTVAGIETTTVGAARTVNVAKNETSSIGGNRSATVLKDDEVTVAGKRKQEIGKDDSLHVKKKLEINAGDEILLKTGEASITMKKNGDIVIKGKNITIEGSGKINAKASGNVVLKGSKVTHN